MQVPIPAEFERFIDEQVESGLFTSAADVVREGLRLLRDRDEQDRLAQEELRVEIRLGLDEADRGILAPLNSSTLGSIIAEARRELAQERGHSVP
ncbi:type II toxin-antitoxin system ParD family antitoxin [Tundrisphaera sp. TA3]|uniref:type II toxin-antitoxin system ParD family antitoxin n=1 Tax=Tundrisphaera sp. TA3 TaxID=3435775 RepID=UPI003EB919C3